MDIFNNLKNNIYSIINDTKEAIKTKENKRNKFINEINTIDIFLKKVKNIYDLNNLSNLKFLTQHVLPILASERDNYEEYLYKINTDKTQVENYMKQYNILSNLDSKILTFTKEIKKYLEYEKEKYNTDDLKKKRNEVKNILSSIEKKKYQDDINIINSITEFMKNNTNLESDEINNITSYMIDEYNKKLELKKQGQLKKENITKPINSNEIISETKEVEEKITYSILSTEDKELVDEVNTLIFSNKNKLKYINNEYIKVLEQNIELVEKDEYKIDIILYKLNIVLSKIFRIQDILNSKDKILETSLNRYINFKDKLIKKLESLYIEYLDIKNVKDEKIDNKDKKTLIYLTNKNDNLYFDINKIDKQNYSAILKMLKELENGYISSSKVKDCSYVYPIKLRGLFRKRKDSARIIYIPYNEYMFILTMYIKNTNYTKYINEYLEHIADDTKDEIKRLKRNLQDPKRKEEIIVNSKIIHNDILEHISNKTSKQKKLK